MNSTLGAAAALLATSLWAISIVFLGEPVRRYGPIVVNFFKATFAAILYWLTVAVLGLFGSLPESGFRSADIGMLILSGIVGMAFGDCAFLEAMKRIGGKQATLLHATAPIFLLVYSWLTGRDALDLREAIGVFAVLFGVAFVVGHQKRAAETSHADFWPGVVWGLIGALGQAAGILLSREAMTHASPLWAASVRLVGASVGLFVGMALARRAAPLIRGILSRDLWRITSAPAFFGTYIGILCMMYAIQNAKAAAAGALLATTPLFVVPASTIIRRERFDLALFSAVLAACLGIAVLALTGDAVAFWIPMSAAAGLALVLAVLIDRRRPESSPGAASIASSSED